MKKKLLKIFATLFVCSILAFVFMACHNNDTSTNENLSNTNAEQSANNNNSSDDSSPDSSNDSSNNNAEDSSLNSTPSHEHDYTAIVTPPTCTEQGYTTYTCSCEDSYIADYVNALDHEFTYMCPWEENSFYECNCLASEATCQTEKQYYYHCSCNAIGTKTYTLGGLAPHSYNDQNYCTFCKISKEDAIFNSLSGLKEYCNVVQARINYLKMTCPELANATYKNLINRQYFPYALLNSLLSYIDHTYSEIESYKTEDPSLYEKIDNRLQKEAYFPRYLLLTLYPDYHTFEEIAELEEFCMRYDLSILSQTMAWSNIA